MFSEFKDLANRVNEARDNLNNGVSSVYDRVNKNRIDLNAFDVDYQDPAVTAELVFDTDSPAHRAAAAAEEINRKLEKLMNDLDTERAERKEADIRLDKESKRRHRQSMAVAIIGVLIAVATALISAFS